MNPITVFKGSSVAIPIANIDTDQITPARYLKGTEKKLGHAFFADWRFNADGSPKADFPLNRPGAQGASVLVAGDNYGCGSSREHAPWALTQFGFRAVISTSFADIFKGNSLKNSLLPIVVPEDVSAELLAAPPDAIVKIDLSNQTLTTPSGRKVDFPVDSFSKHCLVNGVDELGYIQQQEPSIAAFESKRVGSINTLT